MKLPVFNAVRRTATSCLIAGLLCIFSFAANAQITNTTHSANSPYASIQAAIDDAITINGDVITVAAGTYTENIVVNKSLTINGPNAGRDCSGSRVGEAIIIGAGVSMDQNSSPAALSTTNNLTATTWTGQTFRAGISGNLTKITVALGLASGSSGTITVEIRNLNGINPGTTVLATSTLGPVTNVGTAALYTTTFATPAAVVSGTSYSVVLRTSVGSTVFGVRGSTAGGSSLANGQVFTTTNSGTSWSAIAADLYFTTYVTPSLSYPAVKIASDNVTVNGFTVKNPTGSYGVSVQGRSNINVAYNIITDIGDNVTGTGASYGVQIESNAAASSVNITHNCVSNIRGGQTTPTSGSNGSGVGIGTNSTNSVFDLTGLDISYNVISSISASATNGTGGKGAYGVIINMGAAATGEAINATVTNNDISSLNGRWAHGVGLEGITPNALVVNNAFSSFTSAGTDNMAVYVEQNAFVATVRIHKNSLLNSGYGIGNAMATEVDATCNWFGTTVPAGVTAKISGAVNYIPYLTSGADVAPATPGFQTSEACGACSTACSITGSDPVCPSSSNEYSGPDGMSTYTWSLTDANGATITSAANLHEVTVKAGPGCNTSFTLSLTFTKEPDGCSSTCSKTVNVVDVTAPTLTGTPYAGTTETDACMANAAAAAPFSATNAKQGYSDNCGGTVTATLTNTNVTGTNCNWTVTYTFTVKDGCNNELAGQTYSNTGSDQAAPSLTGTSYAGTTGNDACMANAAAAAPFNATNAKQGYSDNCGGTVTATLTNTNVTGTNCNWTVTYTFTVKDGCNNELAGQTYSNTGSDQAAPTLTGTPYAGTTGNDACMANAAAAAPFNATNAKQGYSDNCGGTVTATLTNTNVTGTNCNWTVTYTFTVKDGCNNELTGQTYSNTGGDQAAPTLTGTPYAGTTGNDACMSNAATAAPFSATNAKQGYSDNCGGTLTATLTNTNVTGTNCSWTVTYTFTVKDGCNNELTGQTYSNTGGDQAAPTLTGTPYTGTTGNDACMSNAATAAPFSATNAKQGYSDNCGGTVTATLTNTNVTGTNCSWTVTYTFTVKDGCNNELTGQTYSNTGSDQAAPSLTGTSYAGTTGTNACMANAAAAAPFMQPMRGLF